MRHLLTRIKSRILSAPPVLDNSVLTSLINKRLVIRSGPKYNIYWDNFRDYLVNDEITLIGESYILRVMPHISFDIFRSFEPNVFLDFSELVEKFSPRYSEKTLYNILRQLIDVNVLTKVNTKYKVNTQISAISKDEFIEHAIKKFTRYTPYLKLKENTKNINSVREVMTILQETFKGTSFQISTWEVYTRTFISWISYLGLPGLENIEFYSFDESTSSKIPTKILKNQLLTFTPQKPIRDDINTYWSIVKDRDNFDIRKNNKFLYDLKAIGVIHYWKDDVIMTKTGLQIQELSDTKTIMKEFSKLAHRMNKIKKAVDIIKDNNVNNIKEFRVLAHELVEHINSEIYKRQTLGKIYNWACFIIEYE